MKTLSYDIPLTLHGQHYMANLVLGVYLEPVAPALFLVDCENEREVLAKLSTNIDPSTLFGIPGALGVLKTYSENEGLLEQVKDLTFEDEPIFTWPKLENKPARVLIVSPEDFPFLSLPVYGFGQKTLREYDKLINRMYETVGRPQ